MSRLRSNPTTCREEEVKGQYCNPCYGFIFLQDRDEKILRDRSIDFELDRVPIKYQQATPGGCRVRAIVKDLASSDHGINEKSLYKTLTGITALNNYKIYNRDIRLDNYRDGQIVDFGSSWTEPHRLLDALDHRAARGSRRADRVLFDQMVRDEEIPNPRGVRAMPDVQYCKKLRSRNS